MSSTRKTPEHLTSAKNLHGVAEAVAAEAAEGAGAEVAEAALAAEVASLAAEVASLVAEAALAAEVVVAEVALAAEGVARSERQAARRCRRLVEIRCRGAPAPAFFAVKWLVDRKTKALRCQTRTAGRSVNLNGPRGGAYWNRTATLCQARG
jgi:hypothetical protein